MSTIEVNQSGDVPSPMKKARFEEVDDEERKRKMKRQAQDEEEEMLAASASKLSELDLHPNDEELESDSSPLPKSTSTLSFSPGLHLAPMVRIGSLPTRLMSLQYGAGLVWSPEIVDRAIIGCERIVNKETGLVTYSRERRHIFTTHPIERDRLIFQLGSSSPQWAYQAIRFITENNDVAGVDLNCGCPKPFSTIGGMGAQLLSTPGLLCDILRAMRRAAPSHVSVTCKIRLLPTKEATQDLVRQIIATGAIDALTVHCRTKHMRPRDAAMPGRLQEVIEVLRQETDERLPLICNGDAWDVKEAQHIMEMTGVKAVMMARGPEGNASCFRPEGVLSVAETVAPQWIRMALTFENQLGNTKYCMHSMAFKPSSSAIPGARPLHGNKLNKAKLQTIKQAISRSRTVEEMATALGVDVEEHKSRSLDEVLKDVRASIEEASRPGVGEMDMNESVQKAGEIATATKQPFTKEGSDSGTEIAEPILTLEDDQK